MLCFQDGVEDLLRQQQEDRERIRALEKQLDTMNIRYQQRLDKLQQEGVHLQGCCNAISDLEDRITDAEHKISSASENVDVLQKRLNKELSGGGGGDAVGTEDRLDHRLKVNNTVTTQCTQLSCSYLKTELKDYFHSELGDLRTVFIERFDDQTDRIADVELDLGLMKDRLSNLDKRLVKVENNTSAMTQRLEKCSCGLSEGGGEREKATEKSIEWRVVANEDQIRHFNTRLKDLSVSGDSLYDKVRSSSFIFQL